MYYSKKETYKFPMPREYGAYLAFIDRLKRMGVHYIDEGGHNMASVSITAYGSFDVDDKCDILNMIKEEN